MRPLEGIIVVELSLIISGATCGKVLQEYGAEVIKIESPNGDNYRYFGSVYGTPTDDDENIIFETINSGKKFVKMDLRTDEDLLRLRRLLRHADVFVTNYHPSLLKELGLSYEQIKDEYPRLVYASITGYGEAGPDVGRPGLDTVTFWASSGFIRDMTVDESGNYPVYVPIGAGDNIVGTELAGAIAMALFQRERTGKGTNVCTSLYGTALWTFSSISSPAQYGYKWPRGRYEGSPGGTPYLTSDGYWVLTTLGKYDELWPGLCRAFRAYDLIGNPRFNNLEAAVKPENRKDAIKALEHHASLLTAQEICSVLDEEGIVYTVLGHLLDNHSSMQAMANAYTVPYTYPSGKKVTIVKPPIHFSGCVTLPHTPSRHIGADTEEVYREFSIESDDAGHK